MSKFSRLALLLLAFAPALHAQTSILPKGNVFLGYSYNHLDLGNGFSRNLNGYELSGEGRVLPFIGIVADYSSHFGSSSFHEQNFLVGPRASVTVGRFTPFAHALFGVGHLSVSGAGDTSFGTALGGGLDYRLAGPIAWRGQLDYLHTSFFSGAQNNTRFSTGPVFRF